MAEKEKKQLTTIQYRNRYKRGHIALKIATYISPLIPGSIFTGVNWNEWWNQYEGGSKWQMPFGVIMLLLTEVLATLLVFKKDEDIMKKVSPLVSSFLIVTLLGLSFIFVGRIGVELGNLFLCVAGGMLASIVENQIDKSIVNARYKEYQELVDKYALDKSATNKMQKEKQARLEREEKAKQDGITIEDLKAAKEFGEEKKDE